MKIQFDKYQGAGNDFVILDNRTDQYSLLNTAQIAFLCDRYKGIGADGLILINSDEESDFQMQYFNSDGNQSTLCGNGGRCAVAFAHRHKIIEQRVRFSAVDGIHTGVYESPSEVHLEMLNVEKLALSEDAFVVDTGSPHFVRAVSNIDDIDVKKQGAAVRYSPPFMPEGINVNFVQKQDATHYKIRTYERGVEDETLACGTGAVAAALAMHFSGASEGETELHLSALGGDLMVSFQCIDNSYKKIYLKGPARFVFSGFIEL